MSRLMKLAMIVGAAALTAAGQLTITTKSPMPDAAVGQSYAPFNLQTTGDPGPISWAILDIQNPPPGFTAVAAQPPDTTGLFCFGPPCSSNGVQAPPGLYTFTIQASSQTQTATRQFSLTVTAQPL